MAQLYTDGLNLSKVHNLLPVTYRLSQVNVLIHLFILMMVPCFNISSRMRLLIFAKFWITKVPIGLKTLDGQHAQIIYIRLIMLPALKLIAKTLGGFPLLMVRMNIVLMGQCRQKITRIMARLPLTLLLPQ